MGQVEQAVVYSGLIVVGALVGAVVPLFRAADGSRVTFLAIAAGVMLGAGFCHMLPEAFEQGGVVVLSFTPVGFLMMFVLERYVFVHACEEPPDCAEHTHLNTTLGLTAFLGLSVHTLFDGIALGSSIVEGVGATTFMAVIAHKIPSSLSLAAIFKSEGKERARILVYATIFGLMVPLGTALFFLLDRTVHLTAFAPKALAFSAGTFLYIAVSDLLPHINRHGGGKKLGNVLGVVGGFALMFVLTRVMHEGR